MTEAADRIIAVLHDGAKRGHATWTKRKHPGQAASPGGLVRRGMIPIGQYGTSLEYLELSLYIPNLLQARLFVSELKQMIMVYPISMYPNNSIPKLIQNVNLREK